MSKIILRRALSTALAALMVSGTAFSVGSAGVFAADVPIDPGRITVGMHITNIPDFEDVEDMELSDDDGDGIFTGEFPGITADFPDETEYELVVRANNNPNYSWGAPNESGVTFGSGIPVKLEVIPGESIVVSLDTRDHTSYLKWPVTASSELDLYDGALTIYAGDDSVESVDYDLEDEDGDGIYEAEVVASDLLYSDYYVRFGRDNYIIWGNDGEGGTQFGSLERFPYDFTSAEKVHFSFDTTAPDYRNWKLTTTSYLDVSGESFMLRLGDDTDRSDVRLDITKTPGVYSATVDYVDLPVSDGAAYVYLSGYQDSTYNEETDQWDVYDLYTWGNDGEGGTVFGTTYPIFPNPHYGMNVTYTFDTRDKDLHNWKLTAVCDFDLADACFIANGSFSSGAFEEQYMLTDSDEDGIYTLEIKNLAAGEYIFNIYWGDSWDSYWHVPFKNGITFGYEDVGEDDDEVSDIKVDVTEPGQSIFVSFDTNTGSYKTWLPKAEAYTPPFVIDPDEGIVVAQCENGEVELQDEDENGIWEGEFLAENIGYTDITEDGYLIQIPGELHFTVNYGEYWWASPDTEGVTLNNGYQGVTVEANSGDTIYIKFDTRGEDYRRYTVSASTTPTEALEVISSKVEPDVGYAGDEFEISCEAKGGTAPYRYKYSVTHVRTGEEMDVPADYVSDSSIKVVLTAPGEYDITIDVIDSEGNTASSGLFEAVAYEKPLVNTSTTIPESTAVVPSVNVGETITMVGSATGGKAPYTYSYYFKRSTSTNWKAVKENTTATKATITPTAAASYNIKIVVKDADGRTADALFMVNAVAPFTNTSSLSAEEVAVNNTVKIDASAENGTEPYTFEYFYKRSANTKWNTLKKPSFTPTAVAEYDIKVIATDAAGEKSEKILKLNVIEEKDPLKNEAWLNSETVQIGDDIRATGAATGGKAPYSYAFYFKRSTNTKWNLSGEEFGKTSYITVVPKTAAEYDIKVIVKDADGKTDTKILKAKAVESMALTNVSVINTPTEVPLNKTVTLSGRTVGGTKPVTYEFFFKRSANTKWNPLKYGNEKGTYAKFTPTSAASYDLKVVATDSKGATATKIITITAK